jgi:sensor histidine kinase YesM
MSAGDGRHAGPLQRQGRGHYLHDLMRQRTLWIATFIWWTLNGLVTAADVVTMRDALGRMLTWSHALATGLASAWTWVPLTMGVVWAVRRYPLERRSLARSLFVLNLAVLAVVILRMSVVIVFNPWIGWYERVPDAGELFLTSVRINLFPTWMLIGVAHAVLFAERARQRERQTAELQGRLAQARLEALSAQLNPHFLFNALNSIAELLHQDPEAADRMLVGLGTLLRQSLDTGRAQEVPLHEELRLLDHYVDIEKVRLGSRLHLDWRIEPATLDACVPHLVLQPLVENAIHHAVNRRATPGHVSVSVRRADGHLVLEVQDDGRDGAPGSSVTGDGVTGDGVNGDRVNGSRVNGGGVTVHRHGANGGVGLTNTRARLECLYGADHRLDVEPAPDGGTIARLVVPFRGAPAVRLSGASA